MKKRCPKCKRELDLDEFGRDWTSKKRDGVGVAPRGN